MKREFSLKLIMASILLGLSFVWVSYSISSDSSTLHIGFGTLRAQTGDPILASASGNKVYLMAFYDHLVGVDENLEFNPDLSLAYKWEGNPDLKTWTFWLRKGIKFHNGEDLTADDVKFSMERVKSERGITIYKSYFMKHVDSVEVAGPYKVVYHLKKWDPWFLRMVSNFKTYEGVIMPKDYIEKHGDEYFAEHPVGSGPYRLVENKIGSYMKGEAIENHWRIGTPKFKNLYLRLIPEESSRMAALKTGEIDVTSVSRDRLEDVRAAGFEGYEQPGVCILSYLCFTNPEKNPLMKLKVRKALNLAINREEILQTIFRGMGKVGVIAPATTLSIGYDMISPPLQPYPYEPEKARRLLAEAGYPKGFKLDVYGYLRAGVSEGPSLMEALSGYWNRIGIETKIHRTTWQLWRKHTLRGTHPNPVSLGWTSLGTRLDPVVLYWWYLSDETPFLAHRAHDAKFEMLNDVAQGAQTREEFAKAAAEVYKYVYDNHWFIPIVEVSRLFVANPKVVKHWKLSRREFDINFDSLVTGREDPYH